MSSWPGPGWQGPPRFMQPMPDPRTYAPLYPQVQPVQGWYNYSPNADTYRLTSPSATQLQSSKYPNLNPILAEDTTLLRFDTKLHPSSAIVPTTLHSHRAELALRNPTKKMVLISRAFPWQIDIVSHTNITCEDIWMSLYDALQHPIVDSEWGFIIREKGVKETIESAMKRRLEHDKTTIEKGPRRIDYLGNVTLFRGLEKDEEYAKMRKMPFARECEETWVVKLMS